MQKIQRLILFIFTIWISLQAFSQIDNHSSQNINNQVVQEEQLVKSIKFFPYPPTNFTGDIIDDDIFLSWNAPVGESWIQWDAGINNGNGIGLTNGGIFLVASHWEPTVLTPYDGMFLSKISYFHREDNFASFILRVWTGPNASTQVLSQIVSGSLVNQFNEIELNTPVLIDASQELWFGYAVSHGIGSNPAGCDDGPAIAYNGDMISMDGVSWVSMSQEYGLDYNWNLAAFVTNSDGEQIKLQKLNPDIGDNLLGYNIYRNGIFYDFTTQTFFWDENLSPGNYEYFITALYDEGESEPTNSVIIYFPDFCYPPDSVIATTTVDDYIEISIIPPDSGNYLGFNLYRDGTLIDMISAGTPAFVDGPMPSGIYEYCVTTVCLDGESEAVCDTAQVFVQELLPPTNLVANQMGSLPKIKLDWNAPASPAWQYFNIYIQEWFVPPDTFLLQASTSDTSYIHEVFGYGVWEYYVTAMYSQGESQPSNIAEAYILGNKEIKIHILNIFPNPASDKVKITSPEKIQTIVLYNSFGQLIKSLQEIKTRNYYMDVSHLPRGIYLISVQTADQKFQERLIIR